MEQNKKSNQIFGMNSALASGALALKINLDSESIVFAIYDIIEQGILGYWLLVAHDSSPRM